MTITRVDITPIVTDLQSLKSKIDETISNVNEEDLKKIIDHLHSDSNRLVTKMKKGASLDALHIKTVKELMDTITHTATFAQAVGGQQKHLLSIFHRIETCIKDFESKVAKVDSEPLRKR